MSVILATAGYDHKIRFWEAPSGICSRIIKYPDSQVNRLQITPDKQFIAAAGNPHIRLYEIISSTPDNSAAAHQQHPPVGHHPQHPHAPHGHGGHPMPGGHNVNGNHHHHNQQNGLPVGPNNSNASNANQHQQQPVLTLEGHTAAVTSIGFQKDGRYLYSGSEDGTIKVWDLRNPNYSRSFDSKSPVNSVALRTDRDEFISGDQNGYVKIWDLGGNGCINSLKPSTSIGMSSTSPSKNNNNIGAGSGGTFASAATGATGVSASYLYDEGTVPIQAVDISEDSRTLVAVSNHGTVYVWGTEKNETVDRRHYLQQRQLQSPMDMNQNNMNNPTAMGMSDDGSDHLLTPIRKFRAHAPGRYCLHCKIAPDCQHLVTTGSDGLANLWDTKTWELSQSLRNQKWVWDAAFCADSSYLVTASSDHIARLWNLRTGEIVRQYHGHQSPVTCVALNDSSV